MPIGGGAQEEEEETAGHDGTGDGEAEHPAKIILYVVERAKMMPTLMPKYHRLKKEVMALLSPGSSGSNWSVVPACMACGHPVRMPSSIAPPRRR